MIGKIPWEVQRDGMRRDGLYYFSAISRWPTAQRLGRHDDAASNNERKQKQFRTGARRTNKKRHILGALGYLLTFILLSFYNIYDKNLNGIHNSSGQFLACLFSLIRIYLDCWIKMLFLCVYECRFVNSHVLEFTCHRFILESFPNFVLPPVPANMNIASHIATLSVGWPRTFSFVPRNVTLDRISSHTHANTSNKETRSDV